MTDNMYPYLCLFYFKLKSIKMNDRRFQYKNLKKHKNKCRELKSFNIFGCNISVKVHYLHNHLNRFPENLGDFSEEQVEKFHQDITTIETIKENGIAR